MIESIYVTLFLEYIKVVFHNIFAAINAEKSKLSLNGASHDRQGKTRSK
jgi:hypothetical protein